MPETILTLGALGALFCFIGLFFLILGGVSKLTHNQQHSMMFFGNTLVLLGFFFWIGLMTWIIAEAEYTEERAIRNVIADIYDEIPT